MRALPVLLAGLSMTAASAAPRLHVSTDTLQPESVVELVLDSPATDGTTVGKPTKGDWLVIEPAWAGTTYWKDPSVIEFRPSEPPALGTTYTFKLKEGHTYNDHSAIPAGAVGKFDSPPFQPEYTSILRGDDDDWSPRNPVFYLRFNGDVKPDKAASFLFFEANGGKRVAAKTTRATFAQVAQPYLMGRTWAQRFASRGKSPDQQAQPEYKKTTEVPNGLIVTPVQPLPEGKNWHLTMLRGLPDAAGKTILNEDTIKQVGDIDPLAIRNFDGQVEADTPRQIAITFNAKLPVDMASSLIEVFPKPQDFSVEVDGATMTIKGDFTTQDTWNVTLKKGITSRDGRALDSAATCRVVFQPLEPMLAMPTQDEAQLASGARKYRIESVNMSRLHVRVKRLEGDGIVRAQQGYRYYTGEGANGDSIENTRAVPYEMMVGETISDFQVELPAEMDTSKTMELDWDKILAGDKKPYTLEPENPEKGPELSLKEAGVFFLEVEAQPIDKIPNGKRHLTQSILQLTDIGLAWKVINGEAKVFAFSTLTGKPMAGVELATYGEDAKPLEKTLTDTNGLGTLPRNDAARHLQARSKKDSYTVAFDSSLPTVSLWRFPVREGSDEDPVDFRKVFMFTDRSLYRPGEEMHLKGIVRRQEGNDIVAQPAAKSEMVILNPEGREIYHKPVTVSAGGSFDVSFTLPPETVGTHTVRFQYPGEMKKAKPKPADGDDVEEDSDEEDAAVFSTTFRVDEFRRNAFEVLHELTPPAPGAKEVTVKVKANSFQGQPIANGEVEQFTQVDDVNFYPENFQDYLFGDHRHNDYGYWFHYFGYRWDSDDEEEGRHSDNQSSKMKLAADGTATVTAKLPDGDFPTARDVMIGTEVTDANQQSLNERTRVTVHPANVYIGVKRVDRLVRVGDRLPLEIIAVTPEGMPFKGDVKMEAILSREVNDQVKMSDGHGDEAVRNEAKREQLGKSAVSIAGGKNAEYVFTPAKPGLHQVELRGKDSQGHEFATAVSIQVYGGDEYPWAYEDGMKIKLVAEKKVYQPGDTARVLVLSPIEGTALVTIEREKVLKSFITELRTDKPVLEIPVTDAEAPNVFVSVLVIKGAKDSAREFKAPQLRLGYCELMVTDGRDRLKVALKTPEEAVRPGDEATVSGTVTLADGKPAANAEVTLYAEDEGTLAVMGYENPDPMQAFYNPRTLRVNCGTTLDKLVSESPEDQTFFNKGFFVGGGDDEGGFKDAPRKDFNPCAVWLPGLTTDAAGNFSAKFKLPDTLTRYRVIAVATHGASHFGRQIGKLTVNKDLMVEPQEVRFANEGDTLTVQAHVTNASKMDGTWKIHFDAGTATSEPVATLTGGGAADKTLTLAAGQADVVFFQVHFGNTGSAVFKWSAQPVSLKGAELTPALTHRLSDVVENHFEVEYPMPLLKQSKLVTLKPGKNDLMAALDPDLVKGRGGVQLEFARSLLVEATGSMDFLLHYPYGCVEQTTSSMIPWLAANRLREISPKFGRRSPEEVKKALQIGVNRLLTMQTTDGGFAYWPAGKDSVQWAGPYAGMGLLMAKEQGAEVPDAVIESLCQYLERELRGLGEEKSSWNLETACRGVWVLAMAGKQPDAYIHALHDRLPELDTRARCLLALAMDQAKTGDARALLRDATPFKGHDDSWMRYDVDLPLKLMAWSKIDPRAPETDAGLIALIQDRDPYYGWRTTWVNAWTLLGMASYAEKENLRDPVHLTLTSPDGAKPLAVGGGQSPGEQEFVLKPGLALNVETQERAYVRVSIASKPDLLPSKPVAKNGLEITRLYERVNPDGTRTPLDVPKKGDLIRVTLKMQQPQDYSRYMVVEDYLPSIFEAVNSDFASQAAVPNAGNTSEQSWYVSHSEIRTDRVMFFYDYCYRGHQSVSYLARCTMEGTATAPPAKIEAMYDPDSIALSASREF